MADPKKDEPVFPKRIVSAFFQASIALGEATSITVLKDGGNYVDSIEMVRGEEYGANKLPTAAGLMVTKLMEDRQRPGQPKTLKAVFVPWANVKSVLYGP